MLIMERHKMYKYLTKLLAALAFVCAVPSTAQPTGTISAERATMCDDLYPSQITPIDALPCVVTPLEYPATGEAQVLGDGVSPGGGWAPAWNSLIGEAIDTPNPETLFDTTTNPAGCGSQNSVNPCGRANDQYERKFRTNIGVSHFGYDDPIIAAQIPGGAHLHQFMAACQTTANTTYAQLRHIRPNDPTDCSTAEGGNLNNSAYWTPVFTTRIGGTLPTVTQVGGVDAVTLDQEGDGQLAAVSHGRATIYYINQSHPLPPKFVFIGGYNVYDPSYTNKLVDIANANAPGRYDAEQTVESDGGASTSHYKLGYSCNGVSTKSLRNADGTDGFGGNCPAGTNITTFVKKAPVCWDGTNNVSPNGQTHVVPAIWDSVENKPACPKGWYRIMKVEWNLAWEHCGFAPDPTGCGYGTWWLSSDKMAKNPDGSVGTLPGVSWHFDWFNGWDQPTLNSLTAWCLGSLQFNTNPEGFECNDGAFDTYEKLPNASVSGLPKGIYPVAEKTTMPISALHMAQ